jgi:hypothetical protein
MNTCQFTGVPQKVYLKLTAACQTKARRINKTGITGIKSTIGENGAYASGSFASNIAKDVIIVPFYK